MKTILCVGASARSYCASQKKHQSISKALGESFITEFILHHKNTEVIYRELSKTPPPYITEEFIAACFGGEQSQEVNKTVLSYSDEVISEVEAADIIVITSPMYNYGMPAILKAWFDQVIRINKTFTFDLARGEQPLEPILSGKAVVLLSSWGESKFKKGEENYAINHFTTHVEQLSKYLGSDTFYDIASEFQEFGGKRHEISKTKALTKSRALALHLSNMSK